MDYEELQVKVIEWAKEKGILDNATAITQIGKTQEELDETLEALELLVKCDTQDQTISRAEALSMTEDGIGDMIVTIIITAEMVGLDSVRCLETAYNVIKKRTGKMVNGVFVKDQ